MLGVKRGFIKNNFPAIFAAMQKARRRGDLVPVKNQVTRSGKTFQQTVWVSPAQAAKMGRRNGDLGFVNPSRFKAGQWAKSLVDQKATPDEAGVKYILAGYGAEGAKIADKIRETDAANARLVSTEKLYSKNGVYSDERRSLHGRILQDMLSPDKVEMAKPGPGEKPTFIMLGGRGGSGKSWFKGQVYDPAKFVILDADAVKEQIPEFKGWNAYQVHEESSLIIKEAIRICKTLGLNVVLDFTMSSAESALGKLRAFKDSGYRIEAHYMHLPPQDAARSAIGRFKNGGRKGPNGEAPAPYTGRYVPVEVILKNTENENAFDQVKELADDWSFYSSKGGFPPKLISRKGGKSAKKPLHNFSG